MIHASRIVKLQAAILAVSACVMAGVATMTRAEPPPTASVSIDNFTFRNPVISVKPGTTVTWTNGDDIPHTVVSKDGLFKSRVLDTGDRFSYTFAKPGQFGYFCSIHPHMTGTVMVKA